MTPNKRTYTQVWFSENERPANLTSLFSDASLPDPTPISIPIPTIPEPYQRLTRTVFVYARLRGHDNYAAVVLKFEPISGGIFLEKAIPPGVFDANFESQWVKATMEGIVAWAANTEDGKLPASGFKGTMIGGRESELDSREFSFKIAGRIAVQAAFAAQLSE